MERVLVTGATGALGPMLVRRLAVSGCHVRVLIHRMPAALPDGVDAVMGDVKNVSSLVAAVRDVDTVFHLAALLHLNDPSPSLWDEYWRINVDGTRNLVRAAREAGVSRLVFLSTINVYGANRAEQVFDEMSPLHPESWYAQTKAEAEKVVLSEPSAVVLRAAAIYGPQMKGNYARLLAALQSGRFVMVGAGNNRRTLVHIDDMCTAIMLAACHPVVNQVYNVSDGRLHTLREIIAAMCAALGKAPPRVYVPVAPARLLLELAEMPFRIMRRRPPIRRALLDKFTEDVAVRAQRIQRELGFVPQVDLVAGWNDAVGSISRT